MTGRAHDGFRRAAGTLLLAAWLAVPAGAVASGGNIGFLKDAPLTRFRGPDLELYKTNVADALEKNSDGEVRRWQNPDTGSGGEIELVRSDTRDGKRCRQVRITNRARGYAEARTDAVFCREADGQWKVRAPSKTAPAERPAGPAK